MSRFDFGQRYDEKQRHRISNRRADGSVSVRTDHERGGAGEALVADLLGLRVDHSITAHGDDGSDLRIERLRLQVKTNSWEGPDQYLKVNPSDPVADIYVLVAGVVELRVVGWCWTKILKARGERRDFGYGPKLCVHERWLRPLVELQTLAAMARE